MNTQVEDIFESGLTAVTNGDVQYEGNTLTITTGDSTTTYTCTQEDVPYEEVVEDAFGLETNGPTGILRGVEYNAEEDTVTVAGFSEGWVFYLLSFE